MYYSQINVTQPMLALAARSTSGQSNSYDMGDSLECLMLVNVTAASGTNPTLDIIVQVSDDNSTWYNHTTLAQILIVGNYPQGVTVFGKYVRLSYTIAGITPSFTFQIKALRK